MTFVTVIIVVLLVYLCIVIDKKTMEDSTITDNGTKQIGSNIYLKMLKVNSDHVYFLVDSNGNLASTDISSSFYVGKYRKSATFINPEKLK